MIQNNFYLNLINLIHQTRFCQFVQVNYFIQFLEMDLEERIFKTIYRLFERRSSTIFRFPVDPMLEPNYYEVIKEPMDISKIIEKLKEGKYALKEQVHEDLKLIVRNCLQYNQHPNIISVAMKFDNLVSNTWKNLIKELQNEGIDKEKPLKVTEQTQTNFNNILQKRKNNIFSELKKLAPHSIQSRKNKSEGVENEMMIILVDDETKERENEKSEYQILKDQFNIELVGESERKIRKYRKLIESSLIWMSNTIVKGPFESNRSLAKFETLIELKRILRDKKVLENLKFKNVYEYLLLVGEWMRQYQIVFSYEIKEKFVDTFRKICAYYRWIQKFEKESKIKEEKLFSLVPSFSYGFIVFRRNLPKEDEAILGKFIGMLERDKKKLEEQNIRFEFRENESGMIEVIEEFESNNGSKYVRKQIQERKKEKKYNEKDQELIRQYRRKSNSIIISKYKNLEMNWDKVLEEKLGKLQLRWDN